MMLPKPDRDQMGGSDRGGGMLTPAYVGTCCCRSIAVFEYYLWLNSCCNICSVVHKPYSPCSLGASQIGCAGSVPCCRQPTVEFQANTPAAPRAEPLYLESIDFPPDLAQLFKSFTNTCFSLQLGTHQTNAEQNGSPAVSPTPAPLPPPLPTYIRLVGSVQHAR